jgi:hypothetical protein
MSGIRVKLLSDIHLEHFNKYPGIDYFIPPDSNVDVICLCGDIGCPKDASYQEFLGDCAKKCNMYTFVLMGNHEAYGSSVAEAAKKIESVCGTINGSLDSQKIIFMNNSTFDVQRYRFLGTTLWSDIDPSEAWNIRTCISDYRMIRQWGIGESKYAFDKNVSWLRMNLHQAWEDDKKVVVMTHHAPLLNLGNPKHAYSSLKSAFCSDLHDLIKSNNEVISYWFYGHNHYSETKKIGNTVIMSNQMGYVDEDESENEFIDTSKYDEPLHEHKENNFDKNQVILLQ